ncbi:copper homeostasis protein CutC [Prolixibacteraceae bacterium JC049]|nr:copper homeostasis protein CutC [Prolixibacteraceae bacterium JC049]
MIKEACIENIAEAIEAQKNGADRVELCENLAVGGTTPSYGTIKFCKRNLKIPFMTMIRPRGGNFVYSDLELEIMKEDIQVCKLLGSDGVVFGILTPDNKVDVENTRAMVEYAKPMQVTYHKAFDEVANPIEELNKLIECGVDRVLTSGTKATAEEGKDILNELIKHANGRIKIIVAGKVLESNLADLQKKIKATEFHGRRIVFNPDDM